MIFRWKVLFFCDLLKQRIFWTQKWYKRKLYKQFFKMKTKRTINNIWTSYIHLWQWVYSSQSLTLLTQSVTFSEKEMFVYFIADFPSSFASALLFICVSDILFFILFVYQSGSVFFSGQIFHFLPVYMGF